MKNNLVHTALAVYLAAAVLMLLPGCGGSTDPLQDYKDLRVEQVTDVQSENQTKPQDSYFDLTIGSEKGSAIANFSKGKDGSVEMIVTPRDPKIISYSVELINFTHQSGSTIELTAIGDISCKAARDVDLDMGRFFRVQTTEAQVHEYYKAQLLRLLNLKLAGMIGVGAHGYSGSS